MFAKTKFLIKCKQDFRNIYIFLIQLQYITYTSYLIKRLLFFEINDVRMLDRYNTKKPLVGTLYITATHTIFVEPESNKETWVKRNVLFYHSGLNLLNH